jgi:hypothetical protein
MNIEPIKLLRGSHAKTAQTGKGCVMNVIAYLNGEQFINDRSECVCYTVRPMAIFLNDLADDEQRQRMLPLVLRMMGSATDDKAEISKRLGLLVEFANWQARYAAESAKYSAKHAKSAKYAESAAKHAKYSAESAAEYAAESAEYSAKYAAESAEYAAKYSGYAAESAKYAAKHAAESAAEYAEYKTITFDRGLALLDAILPPAQEPAQIVRERAARLVELNT